MKVFMNKNKTVNLLFLIFSITGFLAVLMAYAYMGSFIRTIGDDYCLGGTLQKHGLWGGLTYSYFQPVPYHGDRYSLIFLSLFFSLFHPRFNGLIPFLTIIMFTAGNFLLIHTINSCLKTQISKWVKLLFSLAMVFFTFLFAPTINQNLYWRTGMLSTLAPVIGNIYLISLILSGKSSYWVWTFLIFLFSVLNGGIAENGAAFQAMTGGILVALGLILGKMERANRNNALLRNSVTAIFGSVIAVIIMWLSPSINHMKAEIDIYLMDSIILSLRHTIEFYTGTFRSYYLGVTAIFVFGFLSFFQVFQNDSKMNALKGNNIRLWLRMMIFSQIASLLLIFSIMLPSAFTRNSYPDPRHLLAGSFALVVNYFFSGFCVAGLILGFIRKKIHFKYKHQNFVLMSAILIFLFSLFYPVRYISKVTTDRILFEYWAFQWDQRHDQIIDSVKAGNKQVHVMTLDHIIEDVGELSPVFESNWYNLCAADFYNLHRIYADQPGWDEGFHEFINSQ